MIQSAAHEAQVTWKTLPAALKTPALNSTTTKNKPKEKTHKQTKNKNTNKQKRNGASWKSEAFPIAPEALNQTTKFIFSVFSDHFIHSSTASYHFQDDTDLQNVEFLPKQELYCFRFNNSTHFQAKQSACPKFFVLALVIKDMLPSYNSHQKLLENNMQNQLNHRITEWPILRLLQII